MAKQFDCSKLRQLSLDELDAATRRQFDVWVLGMQMERDGEYGADRIVDGELVSGFWTWIEEQNAHPDFQANPVFRTFVFVDTVTGDVVATGTIAPDDRGVKVDNGLGGEGLWGGVNVRHHLRGEGIGKFVCAALDKHIADYTASLGESAHTTFHLFTANPVAEGIYVKLGFSLKPLGEINTAAFGDEKLYTKVY